MRGKKRGLTAMSAIGVGILALIVLFVVANIFTSETLEQAGKLFGIAKKAVQKPNITEFEPYVAQLTQEEQLVSHSLDALKLAIESVVHETEIKGENSVNSVVFDNGKEFEVDGVFIEIGSIPNSDLAKRIGVNTNERGEIIINRKSETNVPGIFAAGDVADAPFKQAITGVAEGVIAAYSAFDYLKDMEIEY